MLGATSAATTKAPSNRNRMGAAVFENNGAAANIDTMRMNGHHNAVNKLHIVSKLNVIMAAAPNRTRAGSASRSTNRGRNRFEHPMHEIDERLQHPGAHDDERDDDGQQFRNE